MASVYITHYGLVNAFGWIGIVIRNRPEWLYASTATTLAFVLGMRRVEIRNFRWQDIDFTADLLEIKRSKTKAGYRTPPLNDVCKQGLLELYEVAKGRYWRAA